MYLTRVSDSSNPSSRRTEVVVGTATAMVMVRLFSHWSEPDTGGITVWSSWLVTSKRVQARDGNSGQGSLIMVKRTAVVFMQMIDSCSVKMTLARRSKRKAVGLN